MTTETPSPQAPHDPTRTREAIANRIESLLTRDYNGDDVTRDLCHESARMARRYYFGDELADLWLRSAERMVILADRVVERRTGKVGMLIDDLNRSVK